MLKGLKISLGVLIISSPLVLSLYANSNEIGTDDSYYNNCLRRLEDNSVCFRGMTEDDYSSELYQTQNHVPVQSNNVYVPSEHNGYGECKHGRPATKISDGFVKGEKMISYEDGCIKFIKR